MPLTTPLSSRLFLSSKSFSSLATQVFHYCNSDGKRDTFLCPSNSKFNQKEMTCDSDSSEDLCKPEPVWGTKHLYPGATHHDAGHNSDSKSDLKWGDHKADDSPKTSPKSTLKPIDSRYGRNSVLNISFLKPF